MRKRLDGALADWHPHPKDGIGSLAPMVSDPDPTRDDAPPDEITERFFSETPDLSAPEPPAVVETGGRRAAADTAAIRARRRYLMRYVAGAVSLAALIGVGAIVRVTSARGALRESVSNASALSLPVVAPPPDDPAVMAPAVAPSPGDPTVMAAAVAAPPDDPAVMAPAVAPPPEDPAVVAPAADPAPTPAAADSASEVAADRSEPDPKSAREAKKQALHELELEHLAAATAAGERSVALDPTDADAWLLLGAAYQKRGAYADARRCFASCSKLATRGDRFECAALLQ